MREVTLRLETNDDARNRGRSVHRRRASAARGCGWVEGGDTSPSQDGRREGGTRGERRKRYLIY